MNDFALLVVLFGLLTTLLWLVIGWRAMRAHERIAQSAGLPPERRKYAPHVTLARLDGARPDTIARFIQSVSEPTLPAFVVNEIVLLSARPGTGGGPYVPEATFNLARGTAGTLKSTVA